MSIERKENVEFKTSRTTMSQQDVDRHLQLTAYAFERITGKPPRMLKIVDFVKARSPKILVLQTTRHTEDGERFYHLASHVLRGIREKVFFPPVRLLVPGLRVRRALPEMAGELQEGRIQDQKHEGEVENFRFPLFLNSGLKTSLTH